MEGRQGRGDAEAKFESRRDIENDPGKGNDDRNEGILLKFLPDGRSDFRTGIDHEMVRGKFLRKDRHDPFSNFLLDGRRGLQTDQEFVLLTEFLQLGIAQAVRLQDFSRFVDPDRLVEFQLHRGSAREINAEVRSPP